MRKNRIKDIILAPWFLRLCAVYLLAGFALIPLYKYQIDADGISYISIANKYIAGDFANAVNGYWGPLLSWLLVPFIVLGINPLTAGKIISLMSGFVLFVAARVLAVRLDIGIGINKVLFAVLIPVIYSFFAGVISPDVLVAAFIFLYLCVLFDNEYPLPTDGILCGILGALAYYSKSYAMPFFVVHFSLVNAIYYFRADALGKTAFKKVFISGIAVFLIMVLPWIIALSGKYGKLTVNTTGAYNHAVVGPGYIGHPVNFQGFFEPANATAISIWEDPSLIPIKKWSMFSSMFEFNHQLGILIRNVFALADAYHGMSFLSFAVLLGLLVIALDIKKEGALPIMLILTGIIYSAGYLPIVVRARYFYVCYMLVFLAGGFVITKMFQSPYFDAIKRGVILTGFCVSFLISPAINLIENAGRGKDIYMLSGAVKNDLGSGSRIASDARWMDTLYLSYFLNLKYLGESKKGITTIALGSELEAKHIDFYLVWGKNSVVPYRWKDLSDDEFIYPRILVPPKS